MHPKLLSLLAVDRVARIRRDASLTGASRADRSARRQRVWTARRRTDGASIQCPAPGLASRLRAELDSILDQFGELGLAHIARQWAQLDPRRRRALQRRARET